MVWELPPPDTIVYSSAVPYRLNISREKFLLISKFFDLAILG